MVVDSTLVDRAKSGGTALEELIAAVWPYAFRISLSILRDRGLAEDSAQEACARIAGALPQLQNPNGFSAWSYRLIVRQAIDASRRLKATATLDESLPSKPVLENVDAMDLYDALGALPVAQRAAVILHYYAGFNSGEIAAATGLPASTIRFHLMHARRALRSALSPEAPMPLKSEDAVHNVR